MENIFLEIARNTFMRVITGYLNLPYRWGGDDPSGIDCSGLVVEGLKTIGFIRDDDDYTANGLYLLFSRMIAEKSETKFELRQLDVPKMGTILFFRNHKNYVFHCAVALNQYFQIGAIGGDVSTKTTDIAYQQNAFVKIRPIKKEDKISYLSIFG